MLPEGFRATALSVAVTSMVESADAPVGIVMTPVPEPSDPTGNVLAVKVPREGIVIVNVAVTVFSPLSTVIPVTATLMD